jgi:hypothetical protein
MFFIQTSLSSLRDLEARSNSSLPGAENRVEITYTWLRHSGTSAHSWGYIKYGWSIVYLKLILAPERCYSRYLRYFTMADIKDLSKRMNKSVASMLPHIAATIAERTSKAPAEIDFATAEDWLLRPKVFEVCKDASVEKLTASISAAIFRRRL